MNPNPSNVTPIESKQPATQAKFSITCTLDGFPITIEGEGRAGDLRIIIDRLKAIGAEPPQIALAQSEPTKAAGIPKCPVHNSPMKEGRRGFFCPKKVGQGYCQEVA
jgi:hypothetical protein